ncbi:hypothetical protein CISIN_1g0487302mg, partial [Citrus sinensis]
DKSRRPIPRFEKIKSFVPPPMASSSSSSSDQAFFNNCLLTLYLIAPPTFISLRFLQAPYGKHHRSG